MPTNAKLYLGTINLSGEVSISQIGFTSSTTHTVPAGSSIAKILAVGGGAAGGSPGSNSDTVYAVGGQPGAVVVQTVSVNAGENLTVTVGSAGAASSVSGSFGTVTAAAGSGNGRTGQAGTYVNGWGWFAGSGCGAIKGGAAGYWWAVGTGFPGGGRPTGGVNGYGQMHAVANSGAGGSWGANAASGFVGIIFV